jgi:peptide/nickel transport system substrate-binding protein
MTPSLSLRSNTKKIHRMPLVSALFAGMLLLSGCSTSTMPMAEGEPNATPAPPQTTSITVGLAQVPLTLDPADHRDRVTQTVIRNIFDALVTRDSRDGVHLQLAQDITWIDDVTLRVKLREGVLFHDGVEMTADDVVFTFERIIGENAIEYPQPHSSPRRSMLAPLLAVEKLGTYSVQFTFNNPWPAALQMLVDQQIVPRHYLREVGEEGFRRHPIGTGPFAFISASEDLREIVLGRFDQYYGGAPDLPPVGAACVEEVVFRAIPDPATRAAALLLGEIDIMQSVPQDLAEQLAQRPLIQMQSAPGTQPVWLELNVRHPPFSLISVRQALNLAIDKQRIIRSVLHGNASSLAGPLSSRDAYLNPMLESYPEDVSTALTLFRTAGWVSAEEQNPFEMPPHEPEPPQPRVLIRFTIDTVPEWKFLADELVRQLEEFGMRVTVRVWERQVIQPLLLAGERAAYLDGWDDPACNPAGNLEAKWHTYMDSGPFGQANYSGYDNERVNELILRGEFAPNELERYRAYFEVQEIIHEEAPAVFLVLPDEIAAASLRVENWQLASDGRIDLHDVCIRSAP